MSPLMLGVNLHALDVPEEHVTEWVLNKCMW